MATQTRHTGPMTDAYMAGIRLRNAARTQCKIEQLGSRWLLHPENYQQSVNTIMHQLMLRLARALGGAQ